MSAFFCYKYLIKVSCVP